MKAIIFTTGFTMMFTFLVMQVNAQDAGNTAARKQVAHGNDQADKQLGQKIQQQSLSSPFEKLDTAAAAPPKNKKSLKKSRRPYLKAGA